MFSIPVKRDPSPLNEPVYEPVNEPEKLAAMTDPDTSNEPVTVCVSVITLPMVTPVPVTVNSVVLPLETVNCVAETDAVTLPVAI
jgi:hypothetical protein